jgi:23S rRNA pseudouridine1911/1915/1917 synthase
VGAVSGEQAISPVSGPIKIAYEDDDLLVLDKQAPLAVHPGPGNPDRTLANYLQAYYRQIGLIAGFHPVNRLDRGTSGLMVVAKHGHAHEQLRQALHSPFFRREYLAVCEGTPVPTSGRIDRPIGRVPGSVLRREVRLDGAAACTHYRMLSSHGQRSLLSLKLDTGRTHQIRVHMASMGCPVVGDFLYGKEDIAIPDRFALHATKVEFHHPVTEKHLIFSSPLPSELAILLSKEQTCVTGGTL